MSIMRTLQRAAFVSLLAVTVAACSTAPEQTASLAGPGHIRSWADWSDAAAPQPQTASAPAAGEVRSWGDWSPAQYDRGNNQQ